MPIYDRDVLKMVKPEEESEIRKLLKNAVLATCEYNLSDLEALIIKKRFNCESYTAIAISLHIERRKVKSMYKKAIKKCRIIIKAAQEAG